MQEAYLLLQELQTRELHQRLLKALPLGKVEAGGAGGAGAAGAGGAKIRSWKQMYRLGAAGAAGASSELQQVLDSTLVLAESRFATFADG